MTFSHISYKWSHTVGTILCLTPASLFWDSSMSFAYISSSFLYCCRAFHFVGLSVASHLSVYLFMDTWVVCVFWLFQIKLLGIFVCQSLYGHMLFFVLGIFLGLKWLNHVADIYLIFEEIAKQFPKVVVLFNIFSSSICAFPFLFANTLQNKFFNINLFILIGG